ncbi:ribonuclease HI [Cryobacterium sp. TMT1-21]|uniref:Ribonuclease H n=2 Tax=Cryobacterium TaxID=69578 RepID=A0AAQ2HG37_9MICO|nr:ribonuclease HI [Cryobacterium shii]TFC82473.1 ribonuclease HI [Cryobacterium sp. TmT2-59]TFD12180.1 ribonuclease HI [Cryobacterium sp. TMT1-21]TFD19667.1 ribonuclease HI [Cryobacterium sp. TMT4-10]TFD20619.1 ribonuclease HI [Cryobacterium sp. TMT2-23]
MTIIAAADGSALGNPGPAGWAWFVDDSCWAAGGWKHATNNQGELKAVLELFRATAHLDDDLLVLCDSQYVINSITKWMRGWKAKGWRKADGKPVMNLDLLQELDEALKGRKYRFEWVKGHANHPLNEAADTRARAVSEAFQRSAPINPGPGWVRAGDAPPPRRPALTAPATKPAAVTALPAARKPPAGPAHPELFAFDDEPAGSHTVSLELSPEAHARLTRRAATLGVSVEELLRGLI